MSDSYHLQRFVDAQVDTFDRALGELRAGSKQTHWMWFIFPQLAALGRSDTAQYYGLSSLDEARAYLAHPLLRARLNACVEAMLPWAATCSAEQILGAVDALKLRSSLTLFDKADPAGPFAGALAAFYGGGRDARTLALIDASA